MNNVQYNYCGMSQNPMMQPREDCLVDIVVYLPCKDAVWVEPDEILHLYQVLSNDDSFQLHSMRSGLDQQQIKSEMTRQSDDRKSGIEYLKSIVKAAKT